MRDFKGMKRQRSRNRGGGGGGKPQQHNANRAFESNGPENLKVRGAAQLVYDKYQQLARDAATGGDRVLAENFLQHAEHYYRVLRLMQPQRPASDFISRDPFAPAYEVDMDDEGESAEVVQPDGGDSRGEDDGGYDRAGRDRYDRDRPDRDRDRGESRVDRNGEAPRSERQDRPDRQDRPRDRDRDRGEYRAEPERPQGESRADREGRYERRRERPSGRYGVREDGTVAESPPAADTPPAATATSEDGPMLRSQDGGVFEAPAFLQAAAPTSAPSDSADEDEAPAPRRRAPRRRVRANADEAAPTPEREEV